jgi:D-3-phosphoglycerate dehydrogenase
MNRPVVYSTHQLHRDAVKLLGDGAELRIASALDGATLAAEGRSADIVIVRASLPESLFEGDTRLRAAIRHGAGVDMIPLQAATSAGVLVANVPGVNAPTVAEHVIFAAIGLLRRFRRFDADLRGKGWFAGRAHAESGHDLGGRTAGLIGMGAVGRAVARLAAAFGCKIVGHSPSGRNFPDGVSCLTVDDVLSESDIVVLCCPLKPETRGLIDARRLKLMRRGSLLINVSRGPVVVEEALIAALKSGRLGGAALDVFDRQPLPPDHPFFGFDNVILTAHMAGITEESMARMGVGAIGEALRVLRGELPANLVNPEAVAAFWARIRS